jgi:hypothetical protein
MDNPLDFLLQSTKPTTIKLTVDGKDITELIKDSVISWEFEEEIENGKNDVIKIVLADVANQFRNDWDFKKGMPIHLTIVQHNGAVREEMECGKMWIDEVKHLLSPHEVTIKGTSASPKNAPKEEHKYSASEGLSLKKLGEKTAKDHQLEYNDKGVDQGDSGYNHNLVRQDQINESNLEYFRRLCREKGLFCRIANNTLFVFSKKNFENQDPLMTLSDGDGHFLSGELTTTATGLYQSGKRTSFNSKSGKIETKEHTPEHPPDGVGAKYHDRSRPQEYGDTDEPSK